MLFRSSVCNHSVHFFQGWSGESAHRHQRRPTFFNCDMERVPVALTICSLLSVMLWKKCPPPAMSPHVFQSWSVESARRPDHLFTFFKSDLNKYQPPPTSPHLFNDGLKQSSVRLSMTLRSPVCNHRCYCFFCCSVRLYRTIVLGVVPFVCL